MRALQEPDIRAAICLDGVHDRRGGNLDTHHRTSYLCQQRRSVTLARSDVEHVQSAAEFARRKLIM